MNTNPRLIIRRRTHERFMKARALCVDHLRGVPFLRVMTLLIPRAFADWHDVDPVDLHKAAPPGTRWITAHPNGKDEPGVPILIKESTTNPGEYFVVGGASGKLNHMRITGVKSKEQYESEQKEKRAAEREKKKAEKKQLAKEGKLDAKKAADEAIDAAHKKNSTARIRAKVAELAPLIGVNPATLEFKPTDEQLEQIRRRTGREVEPNSGPWAMLEYQYYQKIESQIDAIIEEKKQKLLADETERAKAGITGMALGRQQTSLELGAAYETHDQAAQQIAQIDTALEEAQTRGDAETVKTLEAKRETYAEQQKQAAAIIDDAGGITVDELTDRKTPSGKGYANTTKDRAVEALVEAGDLDPEKLRAQIGDDRQEQLFNRLQAMGADPETTGEVFVGDMQSRARLLEEAATLSGQGKHEQAFKKWKRAEQLITDWELRADRAVDKGGGEYLDMVAQKVVEGREGMATVSAASREGLTAVPEQLKQAQIDYEALKRAMAVQKKYNAIKDQQATAKEQAEEEAKKAGYQIDSDLIGDKFNVDAMSDDKALEAAGKQLETERMAHWNAALLSEVEESGELTTQLDLSKLQLQRAMAQHISAGAFNAMANATMLSSGDVLIDRPVIDLFGEKGASTMLAAHLRATLDDDHYQSMLEGLEAYHAETSTPQAQAAYERAQTAYEQARAIAFGAIDDPNDPIAMQYLNDQRRAVLESTLGDLGRTIGTLRGQAELISALKKHQKPGKETSISLPVGQLTTDAIIQHMAAAGLSRDEYNIRQDAESGTRALFIEKTALPKIAKTSVTQEDIDAAATAQTIKQGHRDESGWLPHGVANRPATTFERGTPEAAKLAIQPDFKGKSGAALADHTRDYIASRLADGWPLDDITRELTSQSFAVNHLDPYEPGGMDMFGEDRPARDHKDEVIKAVDSLFPPMQLSGKSETMSKEIEAYKADREQRAQALAKAYRESKGLDGSDIHTQGVEMGPHAMEAAHRALANNPATVLAFKAPRDLTLQDKGALRQAFWNTYQAKTGQSKADSAAEKQAAKDKKEQAKAEQRGQVSGMESMFGADDDLGTRDPRLEQKFGPDETIEISDWTGQKRTVNARAWQQQQRDMLSLPDDLYADEDETSMGAGDDEGTAKHAWDRYLQAHGNDPEKAYQSLQEHLRGEFNKTFSATYGKLTGKPLKTASVPLSEAQAHHIGMAADAGEWKQRMQAAGREVKGEMAGMNREASGRFGEGEKGAAARAAIEERSRNQQALFDEAQAQKGESSPTRLSLGDRAEGQIASIVNEAAHRWNPKADPVGLFSIGMGDDTEKGKKFYKQQRAIKMMEVQPKLGLFFGAGSGKSLTTIGMYTHLNHQGKVKRALFAVPSVVQKQFGGEALRYLDPAAERGGGRKGYKWHAEAGASQEERFKAYRDGNTDFMVLTHQGLRDDAYAALSQHTGKSPEEVKTWFSGLSREQRAGAIKQAFDHMGWHGFDMLYIDEAHLLANRQGKADSGMSEVLGAIGDMASHYVRGTGTPVKNDASEAFDHLSQLDPKRFSDRAAFMRQYGGSTSSARAALQRLTARYFYQDRVESGVSADEQRPMLKLTDAQRKQYQDVYDAYNRARNENRDAKRANRAPDPQIIVPAMKLLSPNSFKDQPEDQHLAIAQKLLPAAGAMRDSAYNRVINAGTFEESAKMQEVARLADEYKKQGKPGVVFARNLQAVDELKRGLEAKGHRVTVITGAMSGEEKDKARRAFAPDSKQEKDATADIMILSDAGNTGLNLQRGKWLAHVDTPLTSPTFEQRNARINRLGQTQDVAIHQLLTDTPFDGTAVRRLETKADTSHVFQDPSHALDDTGLAAQVHAAYRARVKDAKARYRAQAAAPAARATRPKPGDTANQSAFA